MSKLSLGLAGAAALVLSVPAQAATIYSNDFETGSTAGISGFTTITTAPNAQKFLGILSEGATSTLTVATAGYTGLTLSFDLYTILSLDGDGTSFCCGPDPFRLLANSATLIDATFANEVTWIQSFPVPGSAGGTGSDPTLTGDLGYSFFGPDHTYHISLALGDNASTILDFIGASNQPASDEGYGIDNIVLTGDRITPGAVPEPSTWAMMIAGFGLAGAALRRRPRRMARIAFG